MLGQWRVSQRPHGRGGVVVDGGANGDEPTTTVVTAMAAVSHPVAPAPPLDRLGFYEWGMGGAVNLLPSAPPPHSYLLWRSATEAHQPVTGWAPPIRVRGESESGSAVGPSLARDQNPTFSPLISTFPFNFALFFTTLML